MNELEGLSNIAKITTNDVILWTIVVILGLVVLVPVYKIVLKSSYDKRKDEQKREEMLVKVVKENTTAITTLTMSIKMITDQQTYELRQISQREEKNSLVLNEIYNILLERGIVK